MGFDLVTFFFMGIKGSFFPAQMVTAGIFLLGLFFLREARKGALPWFIVNFLVVLVGVGVISNLGLFNRIFAGVFFSEAAVWFYMMTAAFFLLTGIFFCREWILLMRGEQGVALAGFIRTPPVWKTVSQALAVCLGGLLAFFSNAWPSGYQAYFQGEMAWDPGKLFYSVGVLTLYEICRNMMVLLVLLFFFFLRKEGDTDFLRNRHSLISITMAAAYFAVGGVVVFLYMTGTRSVVQFY